MGMIFPSDYTVEQFLNKEFFFADVTEVSFHRFVRKGGYRLME